jgi:hypothetical protein
MGNLRLHDEGLIFTQCEVASCDAFDYVGSVICVFLNMRIRVCGVLGKGRMSWIWGEET